MLAARAHGDVPGWRQHLEFMLMAWEAGRMPEDAALYQVFMALEDRSGPAEDRIRQVYLEQFRERFEAIRKEHGLAEDEFWPDGEGPPEDEALNAEYNQARERIQAEVLREWADRLGHPVVRKVADLFESNRLALERRVERGRQYFFGPPCPEMAAYLRERGIIDCEEGEPNGS